jgi:hypothetical protein
MAQALRNLTNEKRSYVERISDLVSHDCVQGARRLVAEAIRLGGCDKDLLRWQSLLGGPKKCSASGDELEPDRTPEFHWLETHAKDFWGQWVALGEGGLLAHSVNLAEVENTVRTTTLSRHPLMYYLRIDGCYIMF